MITWTAFILLYSTYYILTIYRYSNGVLYALFEEYLGTWLQLK